VRKYLVAASCLVLGLMVFAWFDWRDPEESLPNRSPGFLREVADQVAPRTPEPTNQTENSAPRVLLRGAVFAADGTRVRESVTVEAVCHLLGGSALATARTDSKGGFVLTSAALDAASPTLIVRVQARDELSGHEAVPTIRPLLELEAEGWIALRLRVVGRLSGRAVDRHGKGVPGAKVLVVALVVRRAPPYEQGDSENVKIPVSAGHDGRFDLPVRPGRVRLWCSAPAGAYGTFHDGVIRSGEQTYLGDIRVGGTKVPRRIVVRAADGNRVEGARVVIEPKFSVLWLDDPDPEAGLAGWVTDETGEITLDLSRGEEPAILGIAAPGHKAVRVLLDRFEEGPALYEVTLERAHSIIVKIRSGSRLGPGISLPVTVTARRIDAAGHDTRTLLLGVRSDVERLSGGSADPAEIASWSAPSGTEQRSPGEYCVFVPSPGRYRVTARVSGVSDLESEVRVVDDDQAEVCLVLPHGRHVRVSMAPAAGSFRDLRLATRREIGAFRIWPEDAALPEAASATKGKRARHRNALAQGGVAFKWNEGRPVSEFWLESHVSHVVVRPLALREGRFGEMSRVFVPGAGGNAVEISIAYPTFEEDESWPLIKLQVFADGRRVEAASLPIRIELGEYSEEARKNFGPLRYRICETNSNGVASLRLAPGQYLVRLPSWLEPRVERCLSVEGGIPEIRYSVNVAGLSGGPTPR